MAKRHMKRCPTSLIIREIQIKTIMRLSLHTSQIGVQITNAGENVEKREPSYNVGGNVNRYSHYGKQYGHSLTNEK